MSEKLLSDRAIELATKFIDENVVPRVEGFSMHGPAAIKRMTRELAVIIDDTIADTVTEHSLDANAVAAGREAAFRECEAMLRCDDKDSKILNELADWAHHSANLERRSIAAAIRSIPPEEGEQWWCNTHQRPATHTAIDNDRRLRHTCDPRLGGILMPCSAVNLTGEAEIVPEDGEGKEKDE